MINKKGGAKLPLFIGLHYLGVRFQFLFIPALVAPSLTMVTNTFHDDSRSYTPPGKQANTSSKNG
ncbi:hypothetical protein A9Q81_20830 [Gammaproteobacteria bacterium 42_54_T18]|nr:hypothetical protein A9Q81_20830 [Gammaproteobacteria bacterium 42_54_T18]